MRRVCVGAIAVVAMLGMLMVAAPAQAQVSAQTAININMPALTVLFYVGSVTFNVEDSHLLQALTGGAANPIEEVVSAQDDGTTVDAGVAGNLAGSPATALPFEINNAWAVRSIGSTTTVEVSISGATLNDGGTPVQNITIANAETRRDGDPTWDESVNWNPLGMGTARRGDIRFTADISGVTSPANFTGGEITITATTI